MKSKATEKDRASYMPPQDEFERIKKSKQPQLASPNLTKTKKIDSGLKSGEMPEQEPKNVHSEENMQTSFLSMLQQEPAEKIEKIASNSGTNSSSSALKNKSKESVSTMVASFKDIGESEVRVIQSDGGYKVVINVHDKSKIPSNPLLFKSIVEKQLSKNLGANIFVEIK